MYNHTSIGGSTQQTQQQQRRQGSARHNMQLQVTSDNRTASHSASRQQQSGSNLNLIPRPAPPVHSGSINNSKKMKLIRTRATGSTQGANDKKQQRLKSPTAQGTGQGPSIDQRTTRNKISHGRQQSLNLSSNQFLKTPASSAPNTTKSGQQTNNYRTQPGTTGPVLGQDQFVFSASSPPVQINKQAIMMGNGAGVAQQHQQQTVVQQAVSRPIQGKQKESLGHITASRRQKQTGLQINVDGGQSIVITSPSRGHVVASPATNTGVPDNVLFYGSQHPRSTMSPGHGNGNPNLDSLNQISPKGMTQHSQYEQQQPPRRQQQHSALSKKQLRQKVVSPQDHTKQLQVASSKAKQGQQTTYVITPKGGQAPTQFDQITNPMIPRSTKARSSQHYVKGRFIEHHNSTVQKGGNNELDGMGSTQQQTMSTLEQQKQHMKKGYLSPRRAGDNIAPDGTVDEAAHLLFMQSPHPPRRGSNRLISPTNNATRQSAHSSYNNRGKHPAQAKGAQMKQNSSLGFKPGAPGNPSNSNTLKIQNVRVYNETTAGFAGQKVGPATTKHETNQQRYAMRNNFLSPTMADATGRPIFAVADRKDQMARHGGGSNMRHFSNQSSTSVNQQPVVTKHQSKKRKLTLNQRSTVAKTGSLNNSGIMGVATTTSMRPQSGAVKGSRGQQTYSLRTNVAYVSALTNTNPQINGVNNTMASSSTRQSTTAARNKNIQILQTESTEDVNGKRVYSPNAAMNGRRDINAELQNLAVPQFYPSTTTNSQAPRYIQFSQPAPAAQQMMNKNEQQLSMNSACLMDEPQIGISCNDEMNINALQTSNHSMQIGGCQERQNSQIMGQQPHMSASGLSMEQPSSSHHQYMPSNQSRQQLNDSSQCNNMTNASDILISPQSIKSKNAAQLNSFDNTKSEMHQSQKHSEQSRQSMIMDSGSEQQNLKQPSPRTNFQNAQHSSFKPSELHSNDIGGPLVIPNFSINLPQSTTAATAPKISSESMLLEALDPISKNSKDINQKLQQRKVDSARRPADSQSHTGIQTKQNTNLQVVVTHQLNPVVGLPQNGYKQAPQTTTNINNNTGMVPSLNFTQQPQTQQSQASGLSSARPIIQQQRTSQEQQQQQQSSRHQQQQRQSHQSITQRSNPASSHRSQQNETTTTGSQNRKSSNQRSTKQASPSKDNKTQSRNPSGPPAKSIAVQQLNQNSARASRSNLIKDSSSNHFNQQIKFPMTPAKCLKLFGHRHLTEYEKTEILDFPQVFFFGEGAKKVQAQKPPPSQTTSPKFGGNRDSAKNRSNSVANEDEDTNCGYDDSKGNYRIIMKDHIAYRYELVEHLGRGSFGVAIKCFDHKTQEYVAIKIIKNKKKYYYQAGVELKILQYLKDNDPDDTMNIIHMKDYVIFRKHLCITFELMSINLYEFLKLNDFEGLSLSLVRRFAIQLLYSLKFLKENDVIHCDLKPENILLKDPSKSGIKIIDFGSSCFQDERVYTYIQSRFYRAPEIILGIPYTPCIDMWSFGCIMAEFAMGYPIFPGEDETDQISLIMEVCGIPAAEVLAKGQRKTKFFNESNMPKLVPNSHGKVRKPGTKVLDDILECSDQSFVNFVERCLEWDPDKRMSPDEAIRHQWILEGLPAKVLVHHQKLHNIATKSLPPHIREQRAEYLATQPLDVQMEFRDEEEEDDEASAQSYQHHNGRGVRALTHGNAKSKSLDRTAAQPGTSGQNSTANGVTAQIASSSGNPLVVKGHRNSAHAGGPQQTQGTTRHRQAQSFDQSSGYRNNNTSANVNAQQHHNLRQKKQVAVLKSQAANGDTKPTVEQMLHGQQRQ